MDFPHTLHHGTASGVTGSCNQLLIAASSLLVDCGLFQSAETISGWQDWGGTTYHRFSLDGVKASAVSHVHIDHVGLIPYLLATSFKRLIICSEPSAKLLPIVQEEALNLGVSRMLCGYSSRPIILGSPLASRFIQVCRELDHFWDVEALSRLKRGRIPQGNEFLTFQADLVVRNVFISNNYGL